jgi:hypothetical protein
MRDMPFSSFEEEILLYNGEVRLVFEHNLHIYHIEEGGVRYYVPSVTTILSIAAKEGLTWWAANVAIDLLLTKLPFASEEDRKLVADLYYRMKGEKVKAKRDKLRELPGSSLAISTDHTELASLLYDARGRHNTMKDEAADIGRMAHLWLEGHIKAILAGVEYTAPMPDNPQAVSCIEAALRWMDIHNFVPLYSERKIYSRRYGYTGTLDWVGLVTSCGDPNCCHHTGTHKELGDFKSCNAIHDENIWQTAAYLFAILEELEELEIQARRILRLGKEDGEFESKYRSNEYFEYDLQAFLGYQQAHSWKARFSIEKAEQKEAAKSEAKLLAAETPRIEKPSRVKLQTPAYTPIPIAGDVVEVPANQTKRKPRATTKKEYGPIPIAG